ncbi:hypothetical protein HDU97_002642 [Phlyctochytrium planicorne]|nr:hypothetical protein HDU97_002642 [Phlyctochytrium planicorne]
MSSQTLLPASSAASKRQAKYLVTGASGKVGFQTAVTLLEGGHTTRVFLRSNNEHARKLRDLGAEVVFGDMLSYHDLRNALHGITAAFYLPPIEMHMLRMSAAFASAVEDEGVTHITMLSQWYSSPNHESIHTRDIWLTERLFARLPNVTLTLMRLGMFADNFLNRGLLESAMNLGVLPNMFFHGTYAPVSNEDIGRSCAATLLDPAKHGGRVYRPTGPHNVSFEDIEQIVAKVAERKVKMMDLSERMVHKAFRANGIGEFPAQAVTEYTKEYSKVAQEIGTPTDHVQYLTGKKAEDMETIAARYAKNVKTGFVGYFLAVMGLLQIMMAPAFDLVSWKKKSGLGIAYTEEPAKSELWKSNSAAMPLHYMKSE